MSCFCQTASDTAKSCCNSADFCPFDGTLDGVVSEPIFVQKVYDAVLFNLQGMKSVSNQSFSPAIPRGHRLKKVSAIRCKRRFNPENADDPGNLKLNIDTSISGATFIRSSDGSFMSVVGPDGTYSERVLYADTSSCDAKGKGTPIFGTQNVAITGDVEVAMDLVLCDRYDREVSFTVTANVNIARENAPLTLTNFFELCMPSTFNSAFLPRFTEFCNPAAEARLASNNLSRDLTICPDGTIQANLIVALCLTCEKKIIVPVQLCVLTTGMAQVSSVNTSSLCSSFPQLFPDQLQNHGEDVLGYEEDCGCGPYLGNYCECEEMFCRPPCPPSCPPRPQSR